MLRGFDPILAVKLTEADAFTLWQIPLFILLGVACGLMVFYLTSVNEWVAERFHKMKRQRTKWLVGGLVIGLLIYIFPPLYGEGYESITALMNGTPTHLFDNSLLFRHIDWVIILFLVATMFFKVTPWHRPPRGGIGGTFAPSLFIGAFTGATLAVTCNTLFGWFHRLIHPCGYVGVMSGVMNAPLTRSS